MSKLKPKSQSLPVINPNAAGIDIGGRFHVVAVPPDRSDKSVQTFKAFTGDIHNMARWLTKCRITTVAMESTGVLKNLKRQAERMGLTLQAKEECVS
ncbi:transposase [Providencia burhodogranariea DSM 19968]|uniref:Transposase n=1 Tax=Providencia burhodogranariea DSM 19968 TaxID=1141662 RepID=K8X7A6_9GAMM|nr:transposase [Providencia burhodogranariea DSM 19968]